MAKTPPPRTPWTGDSIRLLQACRFLPKKGIRHTLEALACLRRQGINATLTLAGDGPQLAELHEAIAALEMGPFVSLPGFLSQEALREAFLSHDFFLHPSETAPDGDREGIPNAILEAMAQGLPVISTRHSGIPEAITDGEEGILLEHPSGESIAAGIRALLDDPARYARLSAGAHAKVADCFSISASSQALGRCYREAIDFSKAS